MVPSKGTDSDPTRFADIMFVLYWAFSQALTPCPSPILSPTADHSAVPRYATGGRGELITLPLVPLLVPTTPNCESYNTRDPSPPAPLA
jgi:hypothetical protein